MADSAQTRWQDWVNLILGVWLFLSPVWNLAPNGTGMVAWNGYIFGAATAIFAIWALAQPQRWEEWINLLIGVWLIIAPFVLAFTADMGAMWNHIIVGLLIGGDALWAMSVPQPTAHRPA